MKLITKINNKISIWADVHQYVVKIQKSEKSKADYWYLGNLTLCFQEIFEYLCKEKLADGKDKILKEIVQIILGTKKEILEIMKPFEELTS